MVNISYRIYCNIVSLMISCIISAVPEGAVSISIQLFHFFAVRVNYRY